MTKEEIIQETGEFYNLEKLAKVAFDGVRVSFKCMYLTKDAKKCAVGRCLDEKLLPDALWQLYGPVSTMVKVLQNDHDMTLDDVLYERYRGHELSFWESLQEFHDSPINWTEEGLSKDGTRNMNGLLFTYKEN